MQNNLKFLAFLGACFVVATIFLTRQTDEVLIQHDDGDKTKKELVTISNSNDGCRRSCLYRQNKIYFVHSPAGLGDRKSIMKRLAQVAGYLCAQVVLPPPSYLLTSDHNKGQDISTSLEWRDFYNLTFIQDNVPAIKSAKQEFGKDASTTMDWNDVPVFDTTSNASQYKNWLHVISEDGQWKRDFAKVVDYSFRYASSKNHGFIWEWKGSLHNADIFKEPLDGPSADVKSTLSSNGDIYKPSMRPLLELYCSVNGIKNRTNEQCKGCVYTNDDVDPIMVKVMKKELEDRIQSLALDQSYFGHLHIRRGDSINDCDTSIPSMKDFLHCSLNNTKDLGRNITLLMTSDEDDEEYRLKILSIFDKERSYSHISILDIDAIAMNMLEDAIERKVIAQEVVSNYYIYNLEYMLRDWHSKVVDFHLIHRRSTCKKCIRIRKRLDKQYTEIEDNY
ncbi:hypothetical protein CTEN210_03576 [Chaetoceros tenuissimus]|uniref:Uncharacterized protein n=1 Tax=Chaetoceros tenuissimus TaxID=426638 RepID=A0AAD3H1R1_9STRA|nr:hypothetical protein CTEN210_03576 [Chaetoceros tenuissimus]